MSQVFRLSLLVALMSLPTPALAQIPGAVQLAGTSLEASRGLADLRQHLVAYEQAVQAPASSDVCYGLASAIENAMTHEPTGGWAKQHPDWNQLAERVEKAHAYYSACRALDVRFHPQLPAPDAAKAEAWVTIDARVSGAISRLDDVKGSFAVLAQLEKGGDETTKAVAAVYRKTELVAAARELQPQAVKVVAEQWRAYKVRVKGQSPSSALRSDALRLAELIEIAGLLGAQDDTLLELSSTPLVSESLSLGQAKAEVQAALAK